MTKSSSKLFIAPIALTCALAGTGSSAPAYAEIINGDFSNGFDGWFLDTDGLGSPTAGLNDFSTTQQTANTGSARVEVDYYETAGNPASQPRDEAIFANTLYQPLDLTVASGYRWSLSFDWSFDGEATQFDDNFVVGLGDGSGNYFDQDQMLGFLLNPSTYGFGHFETLLDNRFNNASNWSLEFQLNSGFDGYGSHINIDNIALTMTPVPLPSAFWLFSSSLAMLFGVKSRLRKE